MGLYEVSLSMPLLGFVIGTILANFYMCGIMLVLRAVFNMLVRNASPIGHMCFTCLMFNLSRPCEFFFFVLFPLGVVVSVMLCPWIFLRCSLNISVCCVLDSVCE